MVSNLHQQIHRALDSEDPAHRLHQILPPDHPYRNGLAGAVNFEARYIDLKRSEVPPSMQNRYRGYLARINRAEFSGVGVPAKTTLPKFRTRYAVK